MLPLLMKRIRKHKNTITTTAVQRSAIWYLLFTKHTKHTLAMRVSARSCRCCGWNQIDYCKCGLVTLLLPLPLLIFAICDTVFHACFHILYSFFFIHLFSFSLEIRNAYLAVHACGVCSVCACWLAWYFQCDMVTLFVVLRSMSLCLYAWMCLCIPFGSLAANRPTDHCRGTTSSIWFKYRIQYHTVTSKSRPQKFLLFSLAVPQVVFFIFFFLSFVGFVSFVRLSVFSLCMYNILDRWGPATRNSNSNNNEEICALYWLTSCTRWCSWLTDWLFVCVFFSIFHFFGVFPPNLRINGAIKCK